jgi:hypothetical protein
MAKVLLFMTESLKDKGAFYSKACQDAVCKDISLITTFDLMGGFVFASHLSN